MIALRASTIGKAERGRLISVDSAQEIGTRKKDQRRKDVVGGRHRGEGGKGRIGMHVSRRSSNTGLSSALRLFFVELPLVASLSWTASCSAAYLLRPLSGCGDMVLWYGGISI